MKYRPRLIFGSPFPRFSAPSKDHQYHPQLILQHIFNDNGKKLTIDKLLNGKDKEIWSRACGNEIGRLAGGIKNRVQGTNTIEFIKKHQIPINKIVTYANMVCDIRPLKEEINRIRMTIGGDKLPYEFDTASPATDLIETKLIINSVISEFDKGAQFCSINLKDFFLHTLLPPGKHEYMRIHYKYFDDELKKLYNIDAIVANDNYVDCEIKKGMYGLK